MGSTPPKTRRIHGELMKLENTLKKYKEESKLIQIMKEKRNRKKVRITEKGDIEAETGETVNYSIKATSQKGIGTVSIKGEKNLEKGLKKAIKLAKINTDQKNKIKEIKNKGKALEELGKNLEPRTIEEYIEKIKEARQYEEKNTEVRAARISYIKETKTYTDTLGNHEKFQEKTANSFGSYITKRKDKGTYSEYTRSYTDPYSEFLENCKEAQEKSKYFSDKEKQEGKKNILLKKKAISDFLRRNLSYYLDAYKVHKEKSEIEPEQKIGKNHLNIINSGTLPTGAYTTGFDHEGTKKQDTNLIKQGKVKNYLHNDYTAQVFNTESTGNAKSLLNKDSIRMDNLIVEPGQGIDTEKTIIIESITSNIDRSTGDYSYEATKSYEKNGKALHNFVFQGNIFKDLKKLKIGKEKKKQKPGIRSPNLMLKNKEIKPK